MILFSFIGISAVLSFLGWYMVNLVYGETAVILIFLIWVLLKFKMPTICVLLSFASTIAGILMNGNPHIFIFSSVFAFFAWDFANLESSIRKNNTKAVNDTLRLYSMRLITLSISLGLGMIFYLISGFIKFSLSFIIASVLVILTFVCLNRFVRIMRGR